MSFTVHSMSKNDLSCIVRAGLLARLVDRRPDVAATSSAMDGAHNKRRRMAPAEIHPRARERVGRRPRVNCICGRHVWNRKLDRVALVKRFESRAGIRCIGLPRGIDARYAFAA